ncbi:MAG: amino acid adenylation domain-containing protein, partial [bacterium]|nr:amino acid adenylation domain-containing protein [bacterium]
MSQHKGLSGKHAFAAHEFAREGEFWLDKFSGEWNKTGFPYDHPVLNTGEGRGSYRSFRFQFPGPSYSKLTALSKTRDSRLYMLLTAGLLVLMYKYTGNGDIVIGAPIFKQGTEDNFVNTVLPLRCRLKDGMTFKDLVLNTVRQTITDAGQHQNYPMETLIFQLNLPVSETGFPLFDVAVLLENIQEKSYLDHIYPNMIVSFLRTGSGIDGVVEYNSLLYEDETIQRIFTYFQRTVEAGIFNLQMSIGDIEILTEEEKHELLVTFNDTKQEYPHQKAIHELFEEQAASQPDNIAVTYEGEPFTYVEINEKAEGLAVYLRQAGLRREEPVGVMVVDSGRVIVSILSILKAGGAYVPLNADYPGERKRYIINDCNTRFLLTNLDVPGIVVEKVISLDDETVYGSGFDGDFKRECGGGDLAYIIYTSGSTGTPKGVMVEHRSVIRLVKNTNYITFESGGSILLTGALEFDASTFEIWGALLNGLTLHLAGRDTIVNHGRLKRVIRENRVSIMWMTSGLFNRMLDTDIQLFSGLKTLLVGGDVLSPIHINRVRGQFPDLRVINGYGPTENTTFSTTHHIVRDYRGSIPIGKPISNSTVYILDSRFEPVPIGVAGELYVGGDGVARGYLNHPKLTVKLFLNKSFWESRTLFSKRVLAAGGALYKTGDLARWLSDGTVEFLGRGDYQVKIRGYRIEPGEIESWLMRIDGVKNAVVLDRETRDGEKYLCAYVIALGMDIGKLKEVLGERLPDYMVPGHFVSLDEFPLTSNGKVDRRALPEPDVTGGAPYVSPRNGVEETLVRVWSEVLALEAERIGIDSDFFQLGGPSLKPTVMLAPMHHLPDLNISSSPTLRAPPPPPSPA